MDQLETAFKGMFLRDGFCITRIWSLAQMLAGATLILLGMVVGAIGMIGFLTSVRRMEFLFAVSLFCVGSGLSLLFAGPVIHAKTGQAPSYGC